MENETRRPVRSALRDALGGRRAGPVVAVTLLVSQSKDLASLPALRALLASPGGLRLGTLVVTPVTRARRAGVLPPPRAAYVTEDGRALAWFGEGRPCVVHPTLAELCRLHGVETEASLAA